MLTGAAFLLRGVAANLAGPPRPEVVVRVEYMRGYISGRLALAFFGGVTVLDLEVILQFQPPIVRLFPLMVMLKLSRRAVDVTLF